MVLLESSDFVRVEVVVDAALLVVDRLRGRGAGVGVPGEEERLVSAFPLEAGVSDLRFEAEREGVRDCRLQWGDRW